MKHLRYALTTALLALAAPATLPDPRMGVAMNTTPLDAFFADVGRALGSAGVRLHCCSGEMIDLVELA